MTKKITFTFDERKYSGVEGDTLASALIRNGIFLMTSNEGGQLIKTDFAMPVYFAESQESFDNTVTNFAQTFITFDDTTP